MQEHSEAHLGQLFELPPLVGAEPPEASRYSAIGTAAEYTAIGLLLERGHKVAVPVVDDDGVDLIVDYRTTVQIKSSAKRTPYGWLIVNLQTARFAERRRQHAMRPHVDVLCAYARDTKQWWVIPTRAIAIKSEQLVLGHKMEQWLEAWELFDADALAAAT